MHFVLELQTTEVAFRAPKSNVVEPAIELLSETPTRPDRPTQARHVTVVPQALDDKPSPLEGLSQQRAIEGAQMYKAVRTTEMR